MMSALHWISALTLTLTLLCCLRAQPIKRDVNDILRAVSNLKDSIKNHSCIKGLTLYSPTNIYPDNCLDSALNCTVQELSTLESECTFLKHEDEDKEGDDDNLNILRDLLINELDSSQTCSSPECGCQSCEAYEETDVTRFLENIQSLVQQLNSVKK